MYAFCARLALVIITFLQFSPSVGAGTLDDYYLKQFGELNGISLQKTVPSESLETEESARCGMPLKHALSRDWNKLETVTQKVLAKQLASPTLSGSEQFFLSNSGKFLIHYTTSNSDAVPSLSWVQTVAQTLDDVAGAYQARGWRLAPTVNGAPYDVYLRNLALLNLYGQVTAPSNSSFAVPSPGFTNAYASYMELDNDFLESIFTNATGGPYTPLQSLQITAAHEYHHAIQYGYNYYFDIWYAEATSSWMEDELYDNVNQLYNYIPAWLTRSTLSLDIPVSTTTGGGYGRWIFNRYLSEKHGQAVIRGIWEKTGGLASPGGGADIPMVPVLEAVLSSSSYGSSLGTDFFDFAKRVYQRDWTTHISETSKIHGYSPVATYSTYPINSTASNPTPSITLPHYSFAYYKFLPSSSSPSNLNITVTGTSSIKATTFIKNSGGIITEYPFSSVNGASITIPSFSSSSEAVLLLANTTTVDSQSVNFSTDGSLPPVPVTGRCGSANNTVFTAIPIQNLCDSGTASAVTGAGPWDWTCLGSNGGSTATCSAQAPITIQIQNASITSGNGSITSLNELVLTDQILSPATKPVNFIPTGAIDLTTTVTPPGSTVTIQLSNLTSLPMNPVFYKVVGTQWIKLQNTDYALTGNTLTFNVRDNGPYDSDMRLGFIQDPLVIGIDISPPSASNSGGSSGNGCFIATAAYGSYLHPQVQHLRDLRDRYLLTNAPGRAFVALYYQYSPPLADFISRHTVLRSVTRLVLTPLVIAAIHPLIAAMSLSLLIVAVIKVQRRRIKSARSTVHPCRIRTT